ncbi:MAG: phenylacetate--CoA ligase family protein [Rhizomicrobium sp.]
MPTNLKPATAQLSGGERPYFDPIETAPRSELRKLQEERLLQQLAFVGEHSPLIRKTWADAGVAVGDIKSIADFTGRAPLIDKDSLRAWRDANHDAFGGVLCVDPNAVDLMGTSSGTTGDPTFFGESWTHPGDWVWTPREMWGLGLRPGNYVAEFNHVLRSVGRLYFHDMGAIPILINHDASDLKRFVDISRKYRPIWLFHLSSPLIYGMARLEAETGIDLKEVFSSYTACIYGGEPMGKHARELVERWNVPIYEFSSLGDSGTIWECRAKEGFHAWEDLVLLEVLDPVTNEPVPSGGRGEMVITNLVDRYDPLIRYRSGDLVQWTEERCKCGRTHARVWPLGRTGDEILVAGKSVLPRDIWGAIEDVPECAAGLFQIIRPAREVDVLKLRVGYEGTADLGKLAEAVKASVGNAVGAPPDVVLVPNAEIVKLGPPHKIPRIAKA